MIYSNKGVLLTDLYQLTILQALLPPRNAADGCL